MIRQQHYVANFFPCSDTRYSIMNKTTVPTTFKIYSGTFLEISTICEHGAAMGIN